LTSIPPFLLPLAPDSAAKPIFAQQRENCLRQAQRRQFPFQNAMTHLNPFQILHPNQR